MANKIPYYRGATHVPLDNNFKTTEQSVCFEVATDYYDTSKRIEVWFPKSQQVIKRPDRTGFAEILIPLWLIREKGIDKNLIMGIQEFPGEPDVVWMENQGNKYRA